jgi:hypothetical protein
MVAEMPITATDFARESEDTHTTNKTHAARRAAEGQINAIS